MGQPLQGRTVVVTRAASQAAELTTLLESYGAKVIVCPTIEIREPESYERLDEALDHLYGYDWLIFTSTNGVEYFNKRLLERGLRIEILDEIRVCAIGQRTAEKLHDAHVHVDLVPSQSTAEGVFAALSEFAGGEEHLRGLNIPAATRGRWSRTSCPRPSSKRAHAWMSLPPIKQCSLKTSTADASAQCLPAAATASPSQVLPPSRTSRSFLTRTISARCYRAS